LNLALKILHPAMRSLGTFFGLPGTADGFAYATLPTGRGPGRRLVLKIIKVVRVSVWICACFRFVIDIVDVVEVVLIRWGAPGASIILRGASGLLL
jgi:hypothetical protein